MHTIMIFTWSTQTWTITTPATNEDCGKPAWCAWNVSLMTDRVCFTGDENTIHCRDRIVPWHIVPCNCMSQAFSGTSSLQLWTDGKDFHGTETGSGGHVWRDPALLRYAACCLYSDTPQLGIIVHYVPSFIHYLHDVHSVSKRAHFKFSQTFVMLPVILITLWFSCWLHA